MAASRQRLAQAGLVAVALLAGCGSSAPRPGGPTLRLALPLIPRTVDPAKAGDLPSLNVAHELYAGLTRFSGTGVVPDLASSWDVQQGGLVWTFHLRKGLRWSDDRPITAQDFRRSWLRALAPGTKAPLAGPDLGIVKGARGYHATGRGEVGVRAIDPRTLRVTLQHPIPWLDQLVAHPIAAAYRPDAYSGPFRLARRLVLERNLNYWNVRKVKPAKLVFTTATKGADAILPRGTSSARPPLGRYRDLARSASGLRAPAGRSCRRSASACCWLVTREEALRTTRRRHEIANAVTLDFTAPRYRPARSSSHAGAQAVDPTDWYSSQAPVGRIPLALAYTLGDAIGVRRAPSRSGRPAFPARRGSLALTPRPVPTLRLLLRDAGPPARPGIDLVVLGWSSKIFDPYNLLDLFPCGSAFNVAELCDPSYDRLMRQAVRTLNDRDRWEIESRLVRKLQAAAPVVPLYTQVEHVWVKPGVRGFSWSPIGFYELDGMTRS